MSIVNVLAILTLADNLNSWKLVTNIKCCESFFNGSSFISKWNQGIIAYKEKLKWSEEEWHLEDNCEISCHSISCGFQIRPTNEEMCQKSQYRNNTCCHKLRESVAETTEETKVNVIVSTRESGTTPTITTHSTIAATSTTEETITLLSSSSPSPNYETVTTPEITVPSAKPKRKARKHQREKKIKVAPTPNK